MVRGFNEAGDVDDGGGLVDGDEAEEDAVGAAFDVEDVAGGGGVGLVEEMGAEGAADDLAGGDVGGEVGRGGGGLVIGFPDGEEVLAVETVHGARSPGGKG